MATGNALLSAMGQMPPQDAAPAAVGQLPAQPAAATGETSIWDALKSTPMGLALIQSGLSLGGGMPAGQAFSQGLGMYQQMMNQQAQTESATAAATQEAGWKERELGQKDRELDIKDKEADGKLAAKADKMPTGADSSIWGKAQESAIASTPIDQEPDLGLIYRTYNSLAPDGQKVYMPMDTGVIRSLTSAVLDNPGVTEQVIERYSQTYGPEAATRLQARISAEQKRRKKLLQDEEKKAKEDEEAAGPGVIESILQGLGGGTAKQTVTTPQSAYSTIAPQAGSNPWAGASPEVLRALAGRGQ